MCVTLNAFEALSVVAAMPTISNDLRGDSLYGATFSAYFLANVVAIVVTADQADRNGPAAGCLTGCAIFTAGLVIAGTAPLMWVFVVARALQGFGGGALAATAYVGVARGFPTEQHARLFALLSTAWIVPGVAAPPVTGWIVDEFSWRWIFFGLLPLIPVLIVLTVPE